MVGPFGPSESVAPPNRKNPDGHGNVVGLYIPGRNGCERLSRHSLLQNKNWKLIQVDTIIDALNFYDNDKYVQDAIGMKLNHILGGGIQFRRRFHKMTPDVARWHSITYVELMKQIYRYGLACGFAAQSSKPHPDYVGEPILLDLTRVETYVLTDLWARSHFKFFQAQDDVAINDNYEIPNINIIPFNLPTPSGRIKSIADVLKSDYRTEVNLRGYMVLACKLKCHPPLVTERMTAAADTSGMYSSFGISSQASGGIHSQSFDEGPRQQQLQADRASRMAMRALNGGEEDDIDCIKSNGIHDLMMSNQVFVDNDRTVAKPEIAQEPNRYIEFCQKRRDDVFAYFSIPPGVVTSGGGGAGNNRSSSSSINSMIIFVNDQKQLKNRFMTMVQSINNDINNNANMLDVITTNSRKRKVQSDDDVRASIEIEVDMPGIPEDEVVLKMYMLGIVSFECVREIMSAKHGLRISMFNAKPAIDIKLLNGIQPEVPGSK